MEAAQRRETVGDVTAPATESGAQLPALTFESGLPGFPAARHFALVSLEMDDAGVFLLRSLDDPALSFVAAAPTPYWPDYAPDVDDVTVERLGITDAGQALLLVLLTIPEGGAGATANLIAPIVINSETLLAAQVVLNGSPYSVREPFVLA